MVGIILFLPVLLGIIILLARNKFVSRFGLLFTPAVYLMISISVWNGFNLNILPGWLLKYFSFDPAGVLFMVVMSIVFAASSVYSIYYIKSFNLDNKQESVYSAVLLVFVAAMSGVILSTHLALMWVFVEATTLSSALLIYFEKKKSSLEASWKYVYICSIGISLAFVGIIILSIGSRNVGSLFFSDLYSKAGMINPFWMKIAFAFLFVGFGTKIGVAPLHAWLPDAHSEAPSPVSALLSAALLNSALLGMIRIQKIMIITGDKTFSNTLFLVTGFLSLLISAVFMLRVKNYKRMLAYSSIENMGIIFIGISLGRAGIFAAMIHIAAHSLSKTSLFLTSGNILHEYGTKQIDKVRGILKKDSRTGWIWITSLLSISGMPPFPSFISKFLIIEAFFLTGLGWLAVPFFILLAVIMYGMGGAVFKMSFGQYDLETADHSAAPASSYISQLVILFILLAIGIAVPGGVMSLLQKAAGFLT